MFSFIKEISIAEIRLAALNFHFCFRHRMRFNPVISPCPGCGELRYVQVPLTLPVQTIPSYPGQVIPHYSQPFDVPPNIPGNPYWTMTSGGSGSFRETIGNITSVDLISPQGGSFTLGIAPADLALTGLMIGGTGD